MHSNLEIVTAERDQAWIDIAELRGKVATLQADRDADAHMTAVLTDRVNDRDSEIADLRRKLAASQQMHARTAEALNVAQTELMVMQSEVSRLQGFLSAFTPLDSLGRKTKADLMAPTQEVAMKRGGKEFTPTAK